MEFQQVLFKSVLWRGLYFVSQLLLNILIARYYEPEGSGWLFYTLNNYAFILLILSLCIDSGMGYFLAGKKISATRLASLSLAWTGVALVVAFAALLVYPYKPAENKELFYAGSLAFIGGSMLITFFSALFFAKKDFITPNLVLLAVNALLVLALLSLNFNAGGWISGSSFLYIYIFSFLLQGLLLALFFALKQKETPGFHLPDKNEFRLLLRYSLLAFTGNVLTFLVFRSDYWFIHYFKRPAAELGNYIQVSKLAQLFFAVPSFLAAAVFPLIAAGKESPGNDMRALSRIIAVTAILGCLVTGISGKWLFPFMFGQRFDQMHIPFLLLTPGIVCISMAYPLAGYFAGKNRVAVNIVSSLIALLIIVAGNIIFIPSYGIKGAAAVCSAGYAALFFYLLFIFIKEHPSSIKDFFVLRQADIQWIKAFFKKNRADESSK